MAWYRAGWEAGLNSLELWWACSTEYISSNGGCRLPENYRQLTREVVRLAQDNAKVDPTPLRKLGLLIEHHAEVPPAIGRMPITVSFDELWMAAELAVSSKDAICAKGITNRRPGRKVHPATAKVQRLLSEGLSVDEIATRTGKSAANIRTIHSRMKQKSG